jgi:tRNA-2-methylthio-N6-dimethylallyladenosine synthase
LAKRLFIKTYGCQMNAYDSARMADVMATHGWRRVETPEDAELVILNTCHIREKATEKVYSELGRLRTLKPGGALIAVGGCVGQAEGAEMLRRSPTADIVFGPQTYHRLPDMVARAERGERVVDTEFPAEPKFDSLPRPSARGGATAYLTVQEGCDKFCTFCVVPYTRGAERSRPVAEVEAEARQLVASGAREITVLGQNVNAYHGAYREAGDGAESGELGLGSLLRHLAAIPGLARLRYTTSHPRDVDRALAEAHRDVPAVMPYVHLPVQAGSDTVLRAMNRRHAGDDYRRAVDLLRTARPDIALSGDFIVGFPGETAADFAATLALVREIGYAQAYSFKYSARPGTPAANLPGQIPEADKAARLAELQDLLGAQQAQFNRGFVGATLPILALERGRKAGQLRGRSPYMHAVHFSAPEERVGDVVEVRIETAHANSLGGRAIDGDRPGQRAA